MEISGDDIARLRALCDSDLTDAEQRLGELAEVAQALRSTVPTASQDELPLQW